MSNTLLVTGAAGHLGQAVLKHLLDTLKVPAQRVVATTRDPKKLTSWAARGVTVRAANFDNADALPEAFSGAQRVLLISTDSFDRPGARLVQHRNAVRAAEQAGVQHLIYTSMPNPDGSPILVAPDHAGTEQAMRESKLPGWTVLRNHWYFETLLAALPPAIASGQWFSAAGEGRVAYIARDDLALAAAKVLAGDEQGKHTYTLSGAQAYSASELAQLVSRTIGRPLQAIPVPVEGLIQGMVAAGLPQPFAAVLASFDLHTAEGRVAEVTEDFRRLTGQPPRALAGWLAENKAAFLPK